MSYGYDSSSYHGMGAPPASNYNTLYDSANEATSVKPGASSLSLIHI